MISVVIPCFNAASTIRETVESAVTQDCEADVIVIDDGSTDQSAEIVKSFGDRVRCISTPNRGVSAARNLGTREAGGEFIQYLDSDDVLAAGTLRARYIRLSETQADVAYTDWQKLVLSADGAFVAGQIMQPDGAALELEPQVATATSDFWAPPAALLYRRSVVDRIGAWSARLPIIQDARFLFDAAAQGAKFAYVPGVGAYYRVLPDSLSRRSRARFMADCATNTEEIEAQWCRRGGELSDARRLALQRMWLQVAHASLAEGLADFDRGRDGYKRAGGKHWLLESAHVLRLGLGPKLGQSVVDGIIRGRRALRSKMRSRPNESYGR